MRKPGKEKKQVRRQTPNLGFKKKERMFQGCLWLVASQVVLFQAAGCGMQVASCKEDFCRYRQVTDQLPDTTH